MTLIFIHKLLMKNIKNKQIKFLSKFSLKSRDFSLLIQILSLTLKSILLILLYLHFTIFLFLYFYFLRDIK